MLMLGAALMLMPGVLGESDYPSKAKASARDTDLRKVYPATEWWEAQVKDDMAALGINPAPKAPTTPGASSNTSSKPHYKTPQEARDALNEVRQSHSDPGPAFKLPPGYIIPHMYLNAAVGDTLRFSDPKGRGIFEYYVSIDGTYHVQPDGNVYLCRTGR